MPTYEYLCKTCNQKFDYFQSMSSNTLTNCTLSDCKNSDDSIKGKGEVTRIISGGSGLIFKGDGFYITCLLYTSDAADERSSVDLGGRRIIKKKKHIKHLGRDIASTIKNIQTNALT
mgnify:CR=1 FL=1